MPHPRPPQHLRPPAAGERRALPWRLVSAAAVLTVVCTAFGVHFGFGNDSARLSAARVGTTAAALARPAADTGHAPASRSFDRNPPDSAEPAGAVVAPLTILKAPVLKHTPVFQAKQRLAAKAAAIAAMPTDLTVSSFNLLGASHTLAGGTHARYASGVTRMHNAVSLLNSHGVDVVGFQEFEQSQYSSFRAITGSAWDLYPGASLGSNSMRDSIAWRTADWHLVQAETINIPYFHGQYILRPVILLENNLTGRQVWFLNWHNPATTPQHGNNQHWRDVATAIEINRINELRSTGVPVVVTGDMNERERFYGPVVSRTDLVPSNGYNPQHMDVDWVFGSPEITWVSHLADRSSLVSRTTDHPMIVARGVIAPATAATQ